MSRTRDFSDDEEEKNRSKAERLNERLAELQKDRENQVRDGVCEEV